MPETELASRQLVTVDELNAAAARLKGVALRTPLVRLDTGKDSRLFLKPEGLQPIGSFKLRGAYNKIAQLTPDERRRGVITYSSGNHAQGVAYAARALGIHAVVVMPSNAPPSKQRAVVALGARVVTVGLASSERRERAEELAADLGYVLIPPYDDRQIIAGQGTCGLEIAADLAAYAVPGGVDVVLAPTGGGGLLSGVAAAVKLTRPGVKVFGVEPELAGDAAQSFAKGSIVKIPAEQTSRTIADGLRTESIGELNLAHFKAYVDGIVTVSETEIRRAMREIIFAARLVPEPSGAVALAGALFHARELPAWNSAVAIVSGGNVETAVLRQVLEQPRAAELTPGTVFY